MTADRFESRPGDSVILSGVGCEDDDATLWLSATWPGQAFGPFQATAAEQPDGTWKTPFRVPMDATGGIDIVGSCIGYNETTEFSTLTITVNPEATTGVEVLGIRESESCTMTVSVRALIYGGWFYGPRYSKAIAEAESRGEPFDPVGLLEPATFEGEIGTVGDLVWEISPEAVAESPEGFYVEQLYPDNSWLTVATIPWSEVPTAVLARCGVTGVPTPTVVPTPTPTTRTVPTTTKSTAAAGAKKLSNTGSSADTFALTGLLVLAAGSGLVLVARRTRPTGTH